MDTFSAILPPQEPCPSSSSLLCEARDYALHALHVRNRQDVYDAMIEFLRSWNDYEDDAARALVFRRIQSDSVGDPRYRVNEQLSAVEKGWRQERRRGERDPVYKAYLNERTL